MSTLITDSSSESNVKLIENEIVSLIKSKQSKFLTLYSTVFIYSHDFNRVKHFFTCNLFLLFDKPLCVGDRILFVELSERTLIPTERKCWRFIHSVSVLPTLIYDEDCYELAVSVYPLGNL